VADTGHDERRASTRVAELEDKIQRATALIGELRETNYSLSGELAELRRALESRPAPESEASSSGGGDGASGKHRELGGVVADDGDSNAMSAKEKHDSSLVPVVIMGQTYKVRAEEDVAYIEELARFVDTKMQTIAETTGTSDSLKVAILAALNIADELFKAEERERSSDEELAGRVDALVKTLDKTLREPTQTSPAV